MALITWDDSLSVNVAEIDQQHKKLIDLINELNDAMKRGEGKSVVGKTVYNLFNYTLIHFKNEEQYFEKFGYPDTEKHKKEHAAFVQKVTDFKDGIESGKLSLSVGVMKFLRDWLQNHIKGTDKKYSDFFNENGLT